MDETTGLLTIICQHVFHCTCLQKWKGSGCPVCRYTQDEFRKTSQLPCEDEDPAECSVCQSDLNLWACLICGSVGCGRYDGAHAFDHWKKTSHAFAMDLTSQRVWDYEGDAYVHRIIQSKPGGKLLELPAADHSALDPPDWEDAVPREKLENMSVEYTHLLTSQLESQRAYFEEIVERAADKASQASAAAAAAEAASSKTMMALEDLQSKYDALSAEAIPGLERDRTRLEKRADKFEALARRMEKDYREKKTMNQSLLERLDLLSGENTTLKADKADLEEQNRDLTFFISSSQQLQGQGEDIVQGTVSVPEPEVKKKRNKGKGRK
jgi:BRCA1-associated protein